MIFSSTTFLLYFLPVFLLIYHLVPKALKNYAILAASIFFYSWGAPKFVFVIIGSTLIDFYLVKKLHASSQELHRKTLLILSLCLNLGLLAYFKYANFFVENLNTALSFMGITNLAWTAVLLPIGISFYTFQTLTYAIDVYRKIHAPLQKQTDYLLYIMSFPQMIAGPIVRFNLIADQIINRQENIDQKLTGFYRFCIGLAKKVLVANVMAQQADLIFNGDLTSISSAQAWLGIIAYTFQIYFDFSGYSDMAIGLGKMMGFKFPENFNSPYTSKSISEFWRKWHITLGNFMRDYLYIPLGGNRVKSTNRLYFNLVLVFVLSGLWHGASWNFILWGAYHGLFLILDRLFLKDLLEKTGSVLATLLTFILVMIGWVIFRLETLSEIKIYLLKMFAFSGSANIETVPAFVPIVTIAFVFSFLVFFKFGQKLETFFFKRENYGYFQHLFLAGLSIVFLVLCISSITTSGFNPFIYFRF